ncbi:unnamed protein product (macronuclear) [Paramecium tetraurelia]|uniref:Uncharacterized protein n=1 Tax=Paramecium tetraurelia TaxID=5888 RepID=A0BJW1_PARTE|nr:uncharacterized protein GSPATT00029458001 [Paramecium tetraurelia]CAK58828.1 unnamed protein product [Paramecium tetraurelia]|eukprot:XP_001426226.1 hypothetical protein (macronuclear) [Paramecium tetraurelia strain d4-2]
MNLLAAESSPCLCRWMKNIQTLLNQVIIRFSCFHKWSAFNISKNLSYSAYCASKSDKNFNNKSLAYNSDPKQSIITTINTFCGTVANIFQKLLVSQQSPNEHNAQRQK